MDLSPRPLLMAIVILLMLCQCIEANPLDAVLQGAHFLMQITDAINQTLCVDDGGGWKAGQTKFVMTKCEFNRPSQRFVYDRNTQQLRKPQNPLLCVDTSTNLKVYGRRKPSIRLRTCDAMKETQVFAYDQVAKRWVHPHKHPTPSNVCMAQVDVVASLFDADDVCNDDGGSREPPMDLVLAPDEPLYAVPPAILAGTPFLIQLSAKPDTTWCVDLATTTSSSRFMLAACDPLNRQQQLFTYNAQLQQIRSIFKFGLCVDDGGALETNNLAQVPKMSLWVCEPANPNQRFAYDPVSKTLRNPLKRQLCIDDGAMSSAMPLPNVYFHLLRCEGGSWSQIITLQEVVGIQIVVPSIPPAPAPSSSVVRLPKTTPLLDQVLAAVDSGARFLLRLIDKSTDETDLCIDDGGAMTSGRTKILLRACDLHSKNQLFMYDRSTQQLRKPGKPNNLCMDDGGAHLIGGETKFLLRTCDPSSPNQVFVYNTTTLTWRNPLKHGLCMDDGGGKTSGGSYVLSWTCDSDSPNQRIEIVLFPNDPTYAFPPSIVAGAAFRLQTSDKSMVLCMDTAPKSSKLVPAKCDSSRTGQLLVYRAQTKQLQSLQSPDLCVDDGGAQKAGQTRLSLWICDDTNPNQQFAYDPVTKILRNPTKNYLCIDDGNANGPDTTQFTMSWCNPNSPNQRFDMVEDVDATDLVDRTNSTTQTPVRRPLPPPPSSSTMLEMVLSGARFLMRMVGKDNLCLSDGGALSGDGIIKFLVWKCDSTRGNQLFMYDRPTKQLRKPSKPKLCVDRSADAEGKLTLRDCRVASRTNQSFVWDPATMLLSTDTRMCVDDGGGLANGASQVGLATCDRYSANQRIELVVLANEPSITVPSLLQSATPVVFQTSVNTRLCMAYNATIGAYMAATCAITNLQQQLVYASTTMQLQSARNRSLCLDDGGSTATTDIRLSNLTLGPCSVWNANQRFVYDSTSQTLRNPTKNSLCVEYEAISFLFRLTWCNNLKEPQQRFNILKASTSTPKPTKAPTPAPTATFVPTPTPIPTPAPEPEPTTVTPTPEPEPTTVTPTPEPTSEPAPEPTPAPAPEPTGDSAPTEEPTEAPTPAPADPSEDTILDVERFTMRVMGYQDGFCIEDGTSTNQIVAVVRCNVEDPDQIFMYDRPTRQLRNPTKSNMCLDDQRGMKFTFEPCDPSSASQLYSYDATTMQWRNPTRDSNLCFDATDVTKLRYAACDQANNYQQIALEVIPGEPSYSVSGRIAAGAMFMIRAMGRGKKFCLDDGAKTSASQNIACVPNTCDVHNHNQLFTYSVDNMQIRSLYKDNLCLDDGGGTTAGATTMALATCDVNNHNQRFVYDPSSLSIRNPTKNDLCIDDGGAKKPRATKFRLWTCRTGDDNQLYMLKEV